MCWWQLLTVALLTTTARGASISQEALRGHQIWEVSGGHVPQRLVTSGLVDPLDHSKPSRSVRVSPESASEVKAALHQAGVTYRVLVHDLANYVRGEEGRLRRSTQVLDNTTCTAKSCPEPLHSQYMTFDQMEWFLEYMNRTFPDRIIVTSIGKSVEGRNIWMAHIKAVNQSSSSVWVEAGLHAREWISPAVAVHLVHRMVHTSSDVDTFIVPMANPDGYVYTWTTNRFWRKNRRINDGTCHGVDLNRNWDFHFGVGASADPCSEIYEGPFAFSEPETKALRDAMLRKVDVTLVLALHSFGQKLLYPWGWSSTVKAPGVHELIAVGKVFAHAAKRATGAEYSVENAAGGLYLASGSTDDWALAKLKTKYVYTLELRDKGSQRFLLTSGNIIPCSEEVWQGLITVVKNITA